MEASRMALCQFPARDWKTIGAKRSPPHSSQPYASSGRFDGGDDRPIFTTSLAAAVAPLLAIALRAKRKEAMAGVIGLQSPGKQGIGASLEQKVRSLRGDLQPVEAVTAQFPVFLGTGNLSGQNRE
jgi:hypothetical protein